MTNLDGLTAEAERAYSSIDAATAALDLETLKKRIAYNATDLGELGKYVRLEYVFNILDDEARKQ